MVQRKVTDKFCIPKTDPFKSEDRTGKLRPPSPRFQDGKSKGTDMKKKMKRTKSIDRTTIGSSLVATDFIKPVSHPGKPTPDENLKQSPNYMKSTSSFESRKEQSRVRSQASVKIPKKDAKISKPSPSIHTPVKTLTRTPSLKRVRTSTEVPGFKPTRAAKKKCSRDVLREDLNSQRATCSSTLKDSKFPDYLELSRGATESEGTSLTKVCPYTYCSLNGCRHAPLPPLKSFLSAKRRMLKTQQNIRSGCSSPQKIKPSGDLDKEIFGELVVEENAAIQEHGVQEDHTDFYIEIYVQKGEYDSEIGSGSNRDVVGLSNEAPNSGYDSEDSSSIGGSNPIFYNEKIFGIGCFDGILVDGSEEVFVQSGDDETKRIKINNVEVSSVPVEDTEPSALLANQQQYPGEPQQDEIHEVHEPIDNNTQVLELDVCHEEVLGGDFLADTRNAATNQSPEQETNLSIADGDSNEVSDDKCLYTNQINADISTCQTRALNSLDSTDPEDQTRAELDKERVADEIDLNIDAVKMDYSDNSDHNESSSAEKHGTQKRSKTADIHGRGRFRDDPKSNTINIQITKCKKPEEDLEKGRVFNPREPNYLPVTPDQEAEKVDLRHQDLDDRKNAEEWMMDYVLQQTVTRLAPARKKKVALLVEAFEKVIPPRYEPRSKHTSSAFAPARPIQACS